MRVKLNFSPSGPGCDHILIEDLNGNVIGQLNGTLTQDEIDSMGLPSVVGKRVAQAMKDWKRRNPTGQQSALKAAIEREDWGEELDVG